MQSGEREAKVFGCLFWRNGFVPDTSFDIKTGGHRDFNPSLGVEGTRHFPSVSSSYWKRRVSSPVIVYFHRKSDSSNKLADKHMQISFILVILTAPKEYTAPRQHLIQPQNKYSKDEEVT
jgi:hypothetical protein